MAQKFDAEDLLDMVLEVMAEGGALNTRIAAIEAEKVAKAKGVDPTLAPIPTGGFFRQTWNDGLLNVNPAIFYGIAEVPAVGQAGAVAKTYKVFVEVIMVDNGQTNDVSTRMLRYVRALEELYTEAFKPAAEMGNVVVEQMMPIGWKLEMKTQKEIKVGGVLLSITMF